MTTIIGVRAKNPETNEYYVLLASDTRFTHASGETEDESKIYSSKHSNYALASSGKNLQSYFRNDEEAEKILKKGGKLPLHTIEGLLWHIAGTLQQNNLLNNYLLAYQGEHGPILFRYSFKEGLVVIPTNSVLGTGQEYVRKIIHQKIQKFKNSTDEIEISQEELQKLIFTEFKEIVKKDNSVGEAQFAIVTSKFVRLIEDKTLKYSSNLFKEKKTNQENISAETKQYPEAIINHLIELNKKILPNYHDKNGKKFICTEIASELKQLCLTHGVSARVLQYSSKEINEDHYGMPRYTRDVNEDRLYPQLLKEILDGWEHHEVCYAQGKDGVYRVLDPVIGKPLTHEVYQRTMFNASIRPHFYD